MSNKNEDLPMPVANISTETQFFESGEDSDDDVYISCSEDDISVHAPGRSQPYMRLNAEFVRTRPEPGKNDRPSETSSIFIDKGDGIQPGTKPTYNNLMNHNISMSTNTPDLDLSNSIEGMYRILDLVSEQGSGGLVDKIIIAQDSLQEFINAISPGAYVSLTKIRFKALDDLAVKPMGLYGSKEEIVKFLLSIDAVNDTMAARLISSQDEASDPTLRSGLYIVRSFSLTADDEQFYVLYWPQETTWDDSAIDSIRRNRVTFMRYLTKMCDQIVALISTEHEKGIVWTDESEDDTSMDADIGESDRIFKFEVAKTKEQEEDVSVRTGFQMSSPEICIKPRPRECSADDEIFTPKLLLGETSQGFITVEYISSEKSELMSEIITPVHLGDLIKSDAILLNENLSEHALMILFDCRLKNRFPEEYKVWNRQKENDRKALERDETNIKGHLIQSSGRLKNTLRQALVDVVVNTFPTFNREELGFPPPTKDNDISKLPNQFSELSDLYPTIATLFQKTVQEGPFNNITEPQFVVKKVQFIADDAFQQRQIDLTQRQNTISSEEKIDTKTKQLKNFFSSFVSYFTPEQKLQDARNMAANITDSDFLSRLKDLSSQGGPHQTQIVNIKKIAASCLRARITAVLQSLHSQIEGDALTTYMQRKATSYEQIRSTVLIQRVEARSSSEPHSCTHIINALRSEEHGNRLNYIIEGRCVSSQRSEMKFTVHLLRLTANDQQNMQLDPTSRFIPSPHIDNRYSHSFCLPVGHNIKYAQLIENEKLLLVIVDCNGKATIFLDTLVGIGGAIERGQAIKTLPRIGLDFISAYDECKKILALCSSGTDPVLYVFLFDEAYKSMHSLVGRFSLSPQWYARDISILHVCIVSGSEEIVLVDSSVRARIFSLITMQFRPAVLQLQTMPNDVYSSPDGSCLLTSHTIDLKPYFTAYHWSTFGSTPGITLGSLDLSPTQKLVLTSFHRKQVHLVGLDVENHRCRSFVLDITRKVTEFMFQAKGARKIPCGPTAHSCLIDCHSEVWTRFPVIPAVRRQTISSSSRRLPKSLIFATNHHHRSFAPYFSDMIQTFERTTRKPTGNELRGIEISAVTFDILVAELSSGEEWSVSQFRAGEWLVDFFCLIPIHIAITKENRFLPLKDGMSSAKLEKSLLGADVGRIVDNLTFGWYESIFQSYMASKPVKVVSSMGEQSVGKSFALNHLVDTSFAGSAMRTTEGVWMSVAPTDDSLIVALDFEGIHSIERSAQEDALLVLFNTAISNLVLFRNNFALSREITQGLFQSFQSSSTVLDPSTNPTLFQSTLEIIIKDVVDSDKLEIIKEFSLKFQKIVEDEQDINFISRLHAGRLNIIPWPVIESREFYKLFSALKRHLDEQQRTHQTAGEFLSTLKTMMAKLKANDWGAISQTMAAHRAQMLLTFLPKALTHGFTETEPEFEPLKNFDTDLLVDKPDTSSQFYLAETGVQDPTCENTLANLRNVWEDANPRQQTPDPEWVSHLSLQLNHLVDMRIEHVREWIALNLSRFQTGHANVEELRRAFEAATVDLKAGVQLCKAQCTACHLLCVQNRLHEGAHNCQTHHLCIHACTYCDEKVCSMLAGHPGTHLCLVNTHFCGKPCRLAEKQGCLKACTQDVEHEGDHLCAATLHTCGEPCDLQGMTLDGGKSYSCSGLCGMPIDGDHAQHQCNERQCPVPCQLCKRLCANQDHLHGLRSGEIHLCGQEHSCASLCGAPGICQIDTAPQSIEAIFTGKHETFQYTKYTQVAKRLKCIKPIPPGATEHLGPHNHGNNELEAFHFCKNRCNSCGYYCTLPLGHPQQEHDTSHGSMSQTRWAIESSDASNIKLEGRKYSANDDGAPMMCNLVCQAIGRHVHIDYCRAEGKDACDNAEVEHISERIEPYPGRSKDYVTHNLYWRRTGFKDPYSRDDQANFAKCDAMCPGPEHSTTGGGSGQPSYCTLPMFHTSRDSNSAPIGPGYVSNDGHFFSCKNPILIPQAYHVIFIIDRSISMNWTDRKPLADTPVTNTISQRSNNRLGAVYSALHSFWSARHAAMTPLQQATFVRQDGYSIILFNHSTSNVVTNDFTSSPDQLLDAVLAYGADGLTDFTGALNSAKTLIEQYFSSDRTPVIIFLSDGECAVSDETVRALCHSALDLGKPLSFHAVSFGQEFQASSLRRMAQIALDVQKTAPQDPLAPGPAKVISSYSQALDTVKLAENFLEIAESLRKPRGSLLLHSTLQ